MESASSVTLLLRSNAPLTGSCRSKGRKPLAPSPAAQRHSQSRTHPSSGRSACRGGRAAHRQRGGGFSERCQRIHSFSRQQRQDGHWSSPSRPASSHGSSKRPSRGRPSSPTHANLTILGGLTPGGTSVNGVYALALATGTLALKGSLAAAVHDGAGAALGTSSFVFGGGSPTTVRTVQSVTLPPLAPSGSVAGRVVGQLPQARSDLAVATITSRPRSGISTTAYLVGGYDGTSYLPAVLATTDGQNFSSVANLAVPVRYPAVTALGGKLFAFGGQTAAGIGTAVTATADIQQINPATHLARVVGALPQALYGAAAFVLDGHLYVAGGQAPSGQTLTQIYEFDPATGEVHDAGLLPQAVAFAGYATVGVRRVGRRVPGRRRGHQSIRSRPGGRGVRLSAVGHLDPSEPLRGSRGRPGSGVPVPGPTPHRRPGQRPPARHGRSSQPPMGIPVGHHACTTRGLLLSR